MEEAFLVVLVAIPHLQLILLDLKTFPHSRVLDPLNLRFVRNTFLCILLWVHDHYLYTFICEMYFK